MKLTNELDRPGLALLRCPVCDQAMAASERSLTCPGRHSFDVAREGYVNLLASTGKHRPGGDSRAMLLARRRFLERGHYDPFSDAVVRLASEVLAAGPAPDGLCVADVGSGTGHHLGRVAEAAGPTLAGFGFDASKEAARIAARDWPHLWFLVADVWSRLPLAPESALLLLSLFAPRNPRELERLVHPEGALIVGLPGNGHLAELVERLGMLRVHPGKEQRLLDDLARGLRPVHREEVHLQLELVPQDVADLVRMGPSARHLAGAAVEHQLAGAAPTAVSASFVLLVFRRHSRPIPPI